MDPQVQTQDDTTPSRQPPTTSRAPVANALADGGLDRQAMGITDGNGVTPNLRKIIEEYARHNGHADLIRESVDELVGHDPPA